MHPKRTNFMTVTTNTNNSLTLYALQAKVAKLKKLKHEAQINIMVSMAAKPFKRNFLPSAPASQHLAAFAMLKST